ncbi:hypothetical protein, partial [Mesorhizobium sp. M2D.F.Ca.ET.223.01.1.1]|uniref:hypothetical protein n=1 Tax=Mesorhizobium sp. M2D.F.Ca.ET.223.01.1.1 TaxID=2563940 RepID=UPI001AEDEA0C
SEAGLKSYFLEGLADEQQARDVLSATLPAQSDPWIVPDGHGWTIAFFNIVTLEDDGGLAIMAESAAAITKRMRKSLPFFDCCGRSWAALSGTTLTTT